MSENDSKAMARRVALRYLVASSGTELSTIFLHGASKARMACEKLEMSMEKGLTLINDSTHREHIYGEAGDLIVEARSLLSEIQDSMVIISYAAGKIDEKKLKSKVPAGIRDRIDLAVKKDT